MKRMNRAHAITDRRARKFEDRWISSSNDLNAESSQWGSEIAHITHGKVSNHRAVAAEPTTNADRIVIRSRNRFAHPAVTRTG